MLTLLCGLLVVHAAAAGATTACTSDDPYCPYANDLTISPQVVVGQTSYQFGAGTLLAAADGPNNTKIDIADMVDDPDTNTLTTDNGATVSFPTDNHGNPLTDGSFIYTPDPTADPVFTGNDTFTYWIQSGSDTDFGTATLTIKPVLNDDNFVVAANATKHYNDNVFANDIGVDPTFPDVDDTNAHGTVTMDDENGTFTYAPDAGYTGPASFQYTVYDTDDDNQYSATVNLTVDGTPPSLPTMKTPAAGPSLSTTIPISWTAATDNIGIGGYDVQVRTAAWNGGFGPETTIVSTKNILSQNFVGSPGHTYCFRMRSRDKAGLGSAWTAEKCVSIPLKANQVAYSSGWTGQNYSGVYGGVDYYTKTKGASMTRTGAMAKHIYLVVTKCATCGTVQVKWNNVVTANISLVASSTLRKQAVGVASLPSDQSGTLTVTVTSANGLLVLIEGVGLHAT